MPVYIRFENKKQVETTVLNKKPSGDGWVKAPTEFEWTKHYCLNADNNIQERTENDINQEILTNVKYNAQATITQTLDEYRRKYAGYSFEKSESYRIQATAAKNILQSNKVGEQFDNEDLSVIKPLADLRNIDAIEMATIITQKSRQAKRAMAKLEKCEDTIKKELGECSSQETVAQYLENLKTNIESELNQGATHG